MGKRALIITSAVVGGLVVAGGVGFWLKSNQSKWLRYGTRSPLKSSITFTSTNLGSGAIATASAGIRTRSISTQPEHYAIDLHFHTNHSADGVMSPKQAVLWCYENGLDGVAITDHNCWSGVLPAMHASLDLDRPFIVISGYEWSTFKCHINIFGIHPEIWESGSMPEPLLRMHQRKDGSINPCGPSNGPYPSIDDIRGVVRWVHENGGLAQYNHPDDPSCVGLSSAEFDSVGFDCMEVANGASGVASWPDGIKRIPLMRRRPDVAETAGTDTHEPARSRSNLVYNMMHFPSPNPTWEDLSQSIKQCSASGIRCIPRYSVLQTKERLFIERPLWSVALSSYTKLIDMVLWPVKAPVLNFFPLWRPK